MKKIAAIGFTIATTISYGTPLGDSTLQLWQISYVAPTQFADGYTVRGTAKQFEGYFNFAGGQLTSLVGKVPITALSSGLESRDASIRELVFASHEGSSSPDSIEFSAEPSTCQRQEAFWACDVRGAFRIRNEWRPVLGRGYISNYQGRMWLHAEGQIKLSDYSFYAPGPAALKVADQVQVTIDLLGPAASETDF